MTAALLALLALGVPTVKTLSLLNEWSPWTREPLAVLATVGTAAVILRGKLWRAVGVVPLEGLPVWTAGRAVRLVAGASAAGLAVGAVQLEGAARACAVVTAAVFLAGLLAGTRQWAGRHSVVAWTVAPLVLAAGASATILALEGREAALSGDELLRLVFVTALGEELAFRGGLLALAYRVLSPVNAEIVTAVSFGLWHVGNALGDSATKGGLVRTAIVIGTVAFTTLGGCLFSWMRHRTGTLGGPVLTHVASNLPGLALR